MDTSETNIKMCEKAEEIQALAPLAFGELYAYLRPKKGIEWAYDRPQVELIRLNEDGEPCHLFTDDIERCWLPRQDELQELYPRILKEDKLENLVDTICLWSECGGFFNDFVPETMEQLWLILVMKEKYNKVWNGEDWI